MGEKKEVFVCFKTWTRRFIEGEPIYTGDATQVYPDGRRERSRIQKFCEPWIRKEKTGLPVDTLSDTLDLYKYTTHSGKTYYEQVQTRVKPNGLCEIWFIGLMYEDGSWVWVSESLWTDDEIKTAVDSIDPENKCF